MEIIHKKAILHMTEGAIWKADAEKVYDFKLTFGGTKKRNRKQFIQR